MTDYPLLCNDDTVRAIQAGLKTQVRRPVPLQPDYSRLKPGAVLEPHKCMEQGPADHGMKDWGLFSAPYHPSHVPVVAFNSPFGGPGDRLRVRECWMAKNWSAGECAKAGCKDAATHPTEVMHGDATRAIYRASYNAAIGDPGPWHPNIHMPKWVCRTFLPVTAVRVERVQDITEEDAIAEGCGNQNRFGSYRNYLPGLPCYINTAKESFLNLWDSIYASKGLGVDYNPWVWVGTFKNPEQLEQ